MTGHTRGDTSPESTQHELEPEPEPEFVRRLNQIVMFCPSDCRLRCDVTVVSRVKKNALFRFRFETSSLFFYLPSLALPTHTNQHRACTVHTHAASPSPSRACDEWPNALTARASLMSLCLWPCLDLPTFRLFFSFEHY
jgi:hypothetical protein